MNLKIERIYKRYEKWECYKHGFYSTTINHMTEEVAEKNYMDFFKNLPLFEHCIDEVFRLWPNSCLHFLTNPSVNKIAWIGQASICLYKQIPSKFRYAYKMLEEKDQINADKLAENKIKEWFKNDYKKYK
jgi:hypothetical protein